MPDPKIITDFDYEFGTHKSKGKKRPRDTFYAKFNSSVGTGVEAGATLTVFGDPEENDEIDWKLFGGEHPSKGTTEKKKGGQCYAIGITFDGDPALLKEYPKHPTTRNCSKYVAIETGMPKNFGNVRNKKLRLVGRVMPNIHKKFSIIECAIDIFDGKGLKTWFKAIDNGTWPKCGGPFLENNGPKHGSRSLVYLRIDSILKKTKVEDMYAKEITL